ncbi:MAG: hypothetical protein ABJA34_10105 [Pseudonocardiales bacterium]
MTAGNRASIGAVTGAMFAAAVLADRLGRALGEVLGAYGQYGVQTHRGALPLAMAI